MARKVERPTEYHIAREMALETMLGDSQQTRIGVSQACLAMVTVLQSRMQGQALVNPMSLTVSTFPCFPFPITRAFTSETPTVVSANFTIRHSWTLMILKGLHRPAHRSLLIVGPLGFDTP